jgi:hypothetical protein
MASIREQILTAFSKKLAAERALTLDDIDQLPARCLWDFDETAEKTTYGMQACVLTAGVGVMDRVDPDINLSTQANQLLADLVSDATNSDRTLGGLCKSLVYSESQIDYPAAGQQEIRITVTFEITYEYQLGKPDTQ